MPPLLSLWNDHPGLSKHCPFITVLTRLIGKKESGNDRKGNCTLGIQALAHAKMKTSLIINPDSHQRLNRILNKWEPGFASFNCYYFSSMPAFIFQVSCDVYSAQHTCEDNWTFVTLRMLSKYVCITADFETVLLRVFYEFKPQPSALAFPSLITSFVLSHKIHC